jgi:hypothetical protein
MSGRARAWARIFWIVSSVRLIRLSCTRESTASSFLAYRAGFARAKQLQKGTFVGTLDALQKLRAGDVADGTRRIEALCFSAAGMLYSDPDYRDQFVTRTFAPVLIQYRAAYRGNRTILQMQDGLRIPISQPGFVSKADAEQFQAALQSRVRKNLA